MNSRPETGFRPPRLHPFVFPSDTDFRFVLLIVSVLGASMFIYNQLYLAVAGDEMVSEYERCQALAPTPELLPESDLEAPTDFVAATEAYMRCAAPIETRVSASMLGGAAVLLGAAGAMYWFMPTWKVRRERLATLKEDDAPEVVAYLVDLCREIGISRPPTFLLNPLSPARSGSAFGRFGRYYVVINGGLATQFYTDRPAFRAVVLHELAHLRNADVNKTYFTVAIWRAFVGVALVPLVVSLVAGLAVRPSYADLYFAFGVGWRVLALAAVVYLTRNAVLRAREVYADVRASTWDGAEAALGRVLGALPHPKPGLLRSVLRVHPDPQERRRALEDTDALFAMRSWDAFGTGIAVAIALPSVDFLIESLTVGTGIAAVLAPDRGPLLNFAAGSATFFFWALGAGLVFAPLMVGVVGSGAWRTTFAKLARGQAPGSAVRLGLALGVGIQRLALILRHVASSTHEGLFGRPAQQDHRVCQKGRLQEPDCPQRAGGEALGRAVDAVTAQRTPEASLLTVATVPFQGNTYEMLAVRSSKLGGAARPGGPRSGQGALAELASEMAPRRRKSPSGCNCLGRLSYLLVSLLSTDRLIGKIILSAPEDQHLGRFLRRPCAPSLPYRESQAPRDHYYNRGAQRKEKGR